MNNNLRDSSGGICKCGRRMSIGEEMSRGKIIGNYECPDCFDHRVSKPITSEEYYSKFKE